MNRGGGRSDYENDPYNKTKNKNGSGDDDLYGVLGVSREASLSEIRKAYRKLALQYHPDRLSDAATPEERESSAATFTRISNAYEVLGDESQRREYDARDAAGAMPSSSPYHAGGPFGGTPFHFTDPFALFERVFAAEFGMPQQPPQQARGGFPFGGGAFGGGSPFHNAFFADPFGQDAFLGGPRGGAFGGGGVSHDGIFQQFHMMQQQQQMAMQQQMANHHARVQQMMGGMPQSAFYSSSSSSAFGGGGGVGESVSTTTRMINGKRQVVTERVIRKADGTVERKVETTTDDDFPRQFLQEEAQAPPQLMPEEGSKKKKTKGRWGGRRNQE